MSQQLWKGNSFKVKHEEDILEFFDDYDETSLKCFLNMIRYWSISTIYLKVKPSVTIARKLALNVEATLMKTKLIRTI